MEFEGEMGVFNRKIWSPGPFYALRRANGTTPSFRASLNSSRHNTLGFQTSFSVLCKQGRKVGIVMFVMEHKPVNTVMNESKQRKHGIRCIPGNNVDGRLSIQLSVIVT